MVATPWDRCKLWKDFCGYVCMYVSLSASVCSCAWWEIVLSVRLQSPRAITGKAYIKRQFVQRLAGIASCSLF